MRLLPTTHFLTPLLSRSVRTLWYPVRAAGRAMSARVTVIAPIRLPVVHLPGW